jgi:hypothetical protein
MIALSKQVIMISRQFAGKNDEQFERLQWVLKARSTDETRENISGFCVEAENKFVCTDGHRLHVGTIDMPLQVPVGVYRIIVCNNKTVIAELDRTLSFPGYGKVFPSYEPDAVLEANYDAGTYGLKGDFDFFISDVVSLGYPVNLTYLRDLFGSGGQVTVKVYGDAKPIVLEAIGRRAILMPLFDRMRPGSDRPIRRERKITRKAEVPAT